MHYAERTVPVIPPQVWEHLGDLDRWAEMLPTIDQITRLDAGPTRVGSRFRVRQPGLVPAEYTVTDWRPGSGFTWQARTAGITTTAVHELKAGDGGTRLRVGIGWEGPMAWLVRVLFGRKAKQFLSLEAETFARLAESGEHA